MAQKSEQELEEVLENLLDFDGLSKVLSAMESICHKKAAHLKNIWQDSYQARTWEVAGNKIGEILENFDD